MVSNPPKTSKIGKKNGSSNNFVTRLTQVDARAQMFEYSNENLFETVATETNTPDMSQTKACIRDSTGSSHSPNASESVELATFKPKAMNSSEAILRRMSSIKGHNDIEEFQNKVLSLEWLPIAWQLMNIRSPTFPLAKSSGKMSNFDALSINVLSNPTHEQQESGRSDTKQENFGTPVAKPKVSNLQLTPIADNIVSSVNSPSGKDLITKHPSLTGNHRSSISSSVLENRFPSPLPTHEEGQRQHESLFTLEEMTVDTQWLYKYSKYLFDKYVGKCSELTVNLSYEAQSNLCKTFEVSDFDGEINGSQTEFAIHELKEKLIPQIVCALVIVFFCFVFICY